MKSTALEVRNASWVLSGKTLLEDINLKIPTGTCCAVLGPNGAGKSALMALLSGYIWPTRGQVCIHGQRLGEVSVHVVRQTIGLVEPSRSPEFPRQYTTREVVATGLFGTIMLPLGFDVTAAQWGQVDQELGRLGLQKFTVSLFQSLSSGEKMKALLARALVGQATILLLDEPTVGLDMGTRASFVVTMEALMARSAPPTMVVISHHLDELPNRLDHLVLLKEGRIYAQGRPDTILTSDNLSAVFDCPVSVVIHNGRYIATVR